MLTPMDLNLPDKFTGWRNGQFKAITRVISSEKYSFVLEAPCGSGKSLIAAATQRLLDVKVVYCCTTKALQDQLLSDFPYAKTIKGRSNYPCIRYRSLNITAEDCTNTIDNECKMRSSCVYMKAKKEALSAPLAILNTAYFLSEANYTGSFSDIDYLVVDEMDTLESQLMSFIEVAITEKRLTSLSVNPPKYKTKFESWVIWATDTVNALKPALYKLEEETRSEWSTFNPKLLKQKRELTRLIGKLEFFTHVVDKSWIWYATNDRWVFKPVWVSKYANSVLWRHTKKVLGMSATILDPRQLSANIGLREYEYLSMSSPFKKENRPVYVEAVADISSKTIDTALPVVMTAIEKICDDHPNEKILIHTVSYKIRDYLVKNVKSLIGKRFITHSTMNRSDILNKFKGSSRPLVLLSPSMERGVDLPYDQCRVVVIAKVPFPNLGDPQISRRLHGSIDGNNWYKRETISTIIQASGRGCRSADDHSVTYILDGQFKKLYSECRDMFPDWWKESLVW